MITLAVWQRGLWRLQKLFRAELRRLRERLFDLLPLTVAHEMVSHENMLSFL